MLSILGRFKRLNFQSTALAARSSAISLLRLGYFVSWADPLKDWPAVEVPYIVTAHYFPHTLCSYRGETRNSRGPGTIIWMNGGLAQGSLRRSRRSTLIQTSSIHVSTSTMKLHSWHFHIVGDCGPINGEEQHFFNTGMVDHDVGIMDGNNVDSTVRACQMFPLFLHERLYFLLYLYRQSWSCASFILWDPCWRNSRPN